MNPKHCTHRFVLNALLRQVICKRCGFGLVPQRDPQIAAAVDALYSNAPDHIGAANALGSLELARRGTKGGRR